MTKPTRNAIIPAPNIGKVIHMGRKRREIMQNDRREKSKRRLFLGISVFLIAVFLLVSLARADWTDIPWDKRLHFKGGLVLGGMGYIISRSEGNNREKSFILSFSIGTLAGILYELVWDDLINKVEADWEDSLYVTLGSLTASAVCASLDYIFLGEFNFRILIPL